MKKLNDSWPDKIKPISFPSEYFSRIVVNVSLGTPILPNLISIAPTYFFTYQSFNQYSIRITSSKSGSCYFGLYLDNGWFYPGRLLSTSPLSSTGSTGFISVPFSFRVHPGSIIWCAYLTSAPNTAPYLYLPVMGDYSTPILNLITLPNFSLFRRYSLSYPFASLPTIFPAGALKDSINSPVFYFRVG